MFVVNVMMPYAITINRRAPIRDAIRLMLKHQISGLPVVDDEGALVGILSESDFLHRVEIGTERRRSCWLGFLFNAERLASEYIHDHGRTVEDVMTKAPVVTVTELTDLESAAKLMEEHKIKRLPVMRGDRIIGILTRASLIKAIMMQGKSMPMPKKSDQELRGRIFEEVQQAQWLVAPLLDIQVKNGNARISGVVYDERQEEAIKVLVENVPGVKSVASELAWIEPLSGAVILSPGEEKTPKIITLH